MLVQATAEAEARAVVTAVRRVGLEALSVRSVAPDGSPAWLVKVRADDAVLEPLAEAIQLKLRLKEGPWLAFKRAARTAFVRPSAASDSVFRSSDRQLLINRKLMSPQEDGGAGLGRGTDLGRTIVGVYGPRTRFVHACPRVCVCARTCVSR